jgi:hypothetical protein
MFLWCADDYRLTACMNILKCAVGQNLNGGAADLQEEGEDSCKEDEGEGKGGEGGAAAPCTNPECTRSRPNSKGGNKCMCQQPAQDGAAKKNDTAATGTDASKPPATPAGATKPSDPNCKHHNFLIFFYLLLL